VAALAKERELPIADILLNMQSSSTSTQSIIGAPNLVIILDLYAVDTTVNVPVWMKVSGGDAIAARRGVPPTCSAHSKDRP
jgi:hypothetical protein